MAGGEDESERESTISEAVDRVLREEFGLSKFSLAMAQAWLPRIFTEGKEDDSDVFARVRGMLLYFVRHSRPKLHPMQSRCPELLPGLRSKPFWDPSDSPHLEWVSKLEENTEGIKEELLKLRDAGAIGFQRYLAPSWSDGVKDTDDGLMGSKGSDSGDWNVYYLSLHSLDCASNRARCPLTVSVLDSIPRQYEHSFFSSLAPDTHVTPHTGPTNKKLRIQLPLVVPEGRVCRLRAGEEERVHEVGKAIIFDDSFEHEAWNEHSTDARVVLILDIWHPDLSAEEIKFLTFLRAGQLRAAKKASEKGVVEGANDFFTVLHKSKERGADVGVVFAEASAKEELPSVE